MKAITPARYRSRRHREIAASVSSFGTPDWWTQIVAVAYERIRGLQELTYPFHDQTIMVTRCGRICFKGQKVNLSQVFAGQNVGVTQVADRNLARHLHAVRFGLFRRRDVPARTDRQSVYSESVTYVLGINCHPCDRNEPL